MTERRAILGSTIDGHDLDIDLESLVATGMWIQGTSGAGKSWLIRRLIEQLFGLVQIVVIDQEGEYHTLRERFDFVHAAAGGEGDIDISNPKTAKPLARQLLELQMSAVVDVSELETGDMETDKRCHFVADFFAGIMGAPRSLSHPVLFIIDEAAEFVPQQPSKKDPRSLTLAQIRPLSTRGRKRGFCPILASQRIAVVDLTTTERLQNRIIGLTVQGTDRARMADDLGFTRTEARVLSKLEAGQFWVYGGALNREPVEISVGPVETTHPKPGQVIAPTPSPDSMKELLQGLQDLPAADEPIDEEGYKARIAELEQQLKRATKKKPADDPALREELETVKKELVDAVAAVTQLQELHDQQQETLTKIAQQAAGLAKMAADAAGTEVDVPEIEAPQRTRKARRPKAPTTAVGRAGRDAAGMVTDLGAGPEKMLRAAAMYYPDATTKMRISALSGYSIKSSSFGNHLSTLRVRGLIESDGSSVTCTDDGMALFPDGVDELPSDVEGLVAFWGDIVGGGPKTMLEALLEGPLSREELSEATGYSITSSSFGNHLSTLRSRGLIQDLPDKAVDLSDEMRGR